MSLLKPFAPASVIDSPPLCQCEQDQLLHWHCPDCKTLLGYGEPLTGLLSARGELGRPVVACNDTCRDRFLAKLD